MELPSREQVLAGTPEQLAAWSAVHVMGWREDWTQCGPAATKRWVHASKPPMWTYASDWSPAEEKNIAQAFELVDALENRYPCFDANKRRYEPRWIAVFSPAETAPANILSEAITKAAILAAINRKEPHAKV